MSKLIERATTDPDTALDCDDAESAHLRRLFGDESTLMLALRHRWMTTLTAKLDQAAHDWVPADQVRAELAKSQPGLRALLDAGARKSVPLRSLERREKHIIESCTGPDLHHRHVG